MTDDITLTFMHRPSQQIYRQCIIRRYKTPRGPHYIGDKVPLIRDYGKEEQDAHHVINMLIQTIKKDNNYHGKT